ncbi:MAG: hypothetical protein PHF86_11100 [Candidatus Nanoarchaeia archaeon]|nr:hypothetical protein [Candidatus Nanoarchaeia archaeon]
MIFTGRDTNPDIKLLELAALSGNVDKVKRFYNKYSEGDYEEFFNWAQWKSYIERFFLLDKQFEYAIYNSDYRCLEKTLIEMKNTLKSFEILIERLDYVVHFDQDHFPIEDKDGLIWDHNHKKQEINQTIGEYNLIIIEDNFKNYLNGLR